MSIVLFFLGLLVLVLTATTKPGAVALPFALFLASAVWHYITG